MNNTLSLTDRQYILDGIRKDQEDHQSCIMEDACGYHSEWEEEALPTDSSFPEGGSPLAAPSLFTLGENIVEQPQEEYHEGEIARSWYEVRPCGCKSRYCSDCCLKMGLDLRERLEKRLKSFKKLQMWTFTIDPELFDSPRDAWIYCAKKRCISELVRSLKKSGYLKSGHWFCVLEFQMKSTEMPHFHLLLETDYIPHDLVYERWGKFRPKDAPEYIEGKRHRFGSVNFSKGDFKSNTHAARYATKYVIKTPESLPAWVKNSYDQIRRYSVSKGFWGNCERTNKPPKKEKLCTDSCFCKTCRGEKVNRPPDDDYWKEKKTIQEKIDSCGKKSSIFFCCTYKKVNRNTGVTYGETKQIHSFHEKEIDWTYDEITVAFHHTSDGKEHHIIVTKEQANFLKRTKRE